MRNRLYVLLLPLLAALPLHAQGPSSRVSPSTRKAVLTLSPVLIVFGVVSGDYEQRVSPSVSVGAGGTLQSDDGDAYRALEAKVRYYPEARALQGFSVGGTLGVTSERYTTFSYAGTINGAEPTQTRVLDTRPTIGTEVSYQWIIGPPARFAIVLGVGAKRRLGDRKGEGDGWFDDYTFDKIIPTLRANVGVAF